MPERGDYFVEFGIKRRYNGKHWKRLCRQPSCDNQVQSNGFCGSHYSKQLREQILTSNQSSERDHSQGHNSNQSDIYDYVITTDSDRGMPQIVDHNKNENHLKDNKMLLKQIEVLLLGL